MEQLYTYNSHLHKISEQATPLSLELGDNRYFPAVVQQIVTEIGGGYEFSTQERAAVQAGVLAAQCRVKVVEIPEQIAS